MARIGRNQPCPCGSGKKYKLCCLPIHREAERERTRIRHAPLLPEWNDDLDDFDARSNRVVDLIHLGQLDEAEAAACDLLRRHPDQIDGFERLAMVYEARGERSKAAEYYRKAVRFAEANASLFDEELIDDLRRSAAKLGS